MLISKYRIWYQKRDFHFFSVRCWVMCSIRKKRVGTKILVSVFLTACWHHWKRHSSLHSLFLPMNIAFLFSLVGRHWSEDRRFHSQKSPSLAAAWHSRAKWECCYWITPRWSAVLDRIAICLKDRHRHHPATLSKGSKYSTVWKISELPYVWLQSS